MRTAIRHFLLLIKRLGFVLFLYTVCRLIFLIFNYDTFLSTSLFSAFLGGIRFDLSAIALTNLPVIVMSLLPLPWLSTRFYQRFLLILMLVLNTPGLAMNLLDTEYFKFTSKRSTADFFDMIFLGDDMVTLLPSYIKDYWYLFLILVLLVWLSVRFIVRSDFSALKQMKTQYGWQSLVLIVSIGLSILSIRGGIQLRPIDNLSALAYGRPSDIPLIINSPFSVIRSWNKDFLEPRRYMPDDQMKDLFDPVQSAQSVTALDKKNIIILIMESFSKEYVGEKNEKGLPYTPFLDSLSRVGFGFDESYANGRKSITALPSILSGIPALMDQPFITSPYSQTPTDALPYLLSKHGYESHFYHGGKTGTMGFDRYCRSAGFNTYSGKEQYPHAEDYDGNWGIYDRPYFRFVAEELKTKEEPFLATAFSLSSHHPYSIPESLAEQYEDYSDELGRSIRYSDDALQDFFKVMEKNGLVENSLFIITADHIPLPRRVSFATYLGCFSVPIVFYDASGRFDSECRVAQQTDIVPTVMDYLGIKDQHIAWGKSLISSDENWALQYLNNFFQLYENGYLLRYDGKEYSELSTGEEQYELIVDPVQSTMLLRLQAMIQQYENRLIEGAMRAEDKPTQVKDVH